MTDDDGRSRPWWRTLEITVPLAIVAGAALVALAVLVVFRWQIAPSSAEGMHFYRLDRWSGEIVHCFLIARSDALESVCYETSIREVRQARPLPK
jgi:hypothetical protein